MLLRILGVLTAFPVLVATQAPQGAVDLAPPGVLAAIHTVVTPVTFKGRSAVRVVETQPGVAPEPGTLAIVGGQSFRNGTIEVDLAGEPRAGATESSRGFIGLAFRVQPSAARYGGIALWINGHTVGHFAGLRVTPR